MTTRTAERWMIEFRISLNMNKGAHLEARASKWQTVKGAWRVGVDLSSRGKKEEKWWMKSKFPRWPHGPNPHFLLLTFHYSVL
jgi:hypothetical protein